ncbi:MAG TPA: hypothetical protein PLS73_08275 [Saprospiraceae bacterium]|nr:hypothetical protein [Saprospiraceae bacterium]
MKSKWSLFIYLISVSTIFGCSNLQGTDKEKSNTTENDNTLIQSGDPFTGKYYGSSGGATLTLEIKRQADGQYYVFTNGLGPDFASMQGEVLKGSSAGFEFSIRVSENGVMLNIGNQDINFTRETGPSGMAGSVGANSDRVNDAPKAQTQGQNTSDPFEGVYDVSYQGQIREKWTIQHKNGNQYSLISPGATVMGTRNSHQITGFDNINNMSFALELNGKRLFLNVSGIQFELINRQAISQNMQANSSSMDNRILGAWSGSKSYNSSGGVGDASISYGQAYGFKADGTYEYKDFNAGGGAGFSGSSESGIQTGQYQIVRMDQEGGVISVDGRQMEYVFFSNGSKMKMGNMIYNRK